jgi:hypothetical protein
MAVRRHSRHRSVTHRAAHHAAHRGRKVSTRKSVHHKVSHHHGKKGHTVTHITTTAHSRTVGKAGSAHRGRTARGRRSGTAARRKASIGPGNRNRTKAAQFPAFPTGYPTNLGF